MPAVPTTSRSRTPAGVFPANPGQAGMIIAAFTGLLYLTGAADMVLGGALSREGIRPRQLDGLDGVLWAPLLHAGWQHLVANTIPVLVLGFFVLANGVGQFLAVTATVWLVGGVGTWLTGTPGTVNLGASVLVLGWLMFLLCRGFFSDRTGQIVLAVVLFAFWGGMLWRVLPGHIAISWQGHLFGALGGLLAGWLVARADRPVRTSVS
ncbi:MAG TPA: rhomboid family intramembrane serine protease [Pseudonocardiaceae bacterium]